MVSEEIIFVYSHFLHYGSHGNQYKHGREEGGGQKHVADTRLFKDVTADNSLWVYIRE